MDRPDELFARESEWNALTRFVDSRLQQPVLGVVSGRRRQGKSLLLEAATRASGGVYLPANEATSAEALRQFGRQLAEAYGSPGALALDSWSQAVALLMRLGADRPRLVVVDEFPYLAQVAPELPSLIQIALGPGAPPSLVRLVLCGSAMSFMGGLLSGAAPLRGRASMELVVRPFDYRTAAQFWGIEDPALAVRVHATVGGTPAYRREFVRDDVPASLEDFDAWMVRTILDSSHPLLREGRYLLAEDPSIRDRGLYSSVLAAVTLGRTTRGAIADYVGRPAADLAHVLSVLEDGGWLRREEDALRSLRPRYRVDDPFLLFHHAIVRPQWTALERGHAGEVWGAAQQTFSAQVLGPHMEEIARDWTADHASTETLGGMPHRVTSTVVADPGRRTQHEVDVVAVRGDGERRTVLAIGEVKANRVLDGRDLDRLVHVRELLRRRDGLDAQDTRLLLFSGGGFSDELRAREHTGDVVLVGPERLYRGE